jgi:hypothetical protein
MGAIVGIDAKVQISTDSGSTFKDISERNEFSIAIKVDTAEHKTFVTSLSAAWATKQRTWMSWSGSLTGYYDDASDEIFTDVIAGQTVVLRFYDSRAATTKYWQGSALLTSVDHATKNSDFSTLNVNFEGVGALTRVNS